MIAGKSIAVKLLLIAGLVPLIASCARAPATSISGARLVVTLRFSQAVNPNYHYFFVIRNAGDSTGRNGPVPVILPPYGGNGFAAGKDTSGATVAFTDFVEYSKVQPQSTSSGYAVYHVPGGVAGNPLLNVYEARGEPLTYQDATGSTIVKFTLALSQIAPSTGETDPNNGQTPQYLQVNAIAVTTTPANSTTIDGSYVVDAFGDQSQGTSSDSFNSFLTIDTTQTGKVYQSTDSSTPNLAEPEGDPYPSNRDPAIDMVYWSIQIVGGS